MTPLLTPLSTDRDDAEAGDGEEAGRGADQQGAVRLHHHVGGRAHRHPAGQRGVLHVLLATAAERPVRGAAVWSGGRGSGRGYWVGMALC